LRSVVFFGAVIVAFLPGIVRASLDSAGNAKDLCSVTRFADSLGYSWHWERAFNRLTCVRQSDQLRFYENIGFCQKNGTTIRLSQLPQRNGAALFLPRRALAELFAVRRDTVTQETPAAPELPDRTVLSSRQSGVNILSVAVEKKRNGTLLSIVLADSLPFDVTYFYPNLTFNFFGGRVDTAAIKRLERVGVVNSVFTIQFESSAQVTALLNHDIEDPMVDYVQDTRTIMISLRPSKPAPKPVRSAAVAGDTASAVSSTIVVIDPGHGGKDPGCIGVSGVKEKDVVLPIALALREKLKSKKGLTIHMTREKDVFVPLIDRTKFANTKKAHLFISIHADAISGDAKRKQSTSGYTIYFLSQAKNEEDKLVAMRENAVIKFEEKPQNYSNLQNVLIEMAGNEYLSESQDLCIMLEKNFSDALKKKMTRLHRGIGQANFWVLNGAFMPSVLIETGFLSNKKEEQLLADADFRREMAAAMSEAIVAFCTKYGAAGL
jgi:N-acetylmuramoyl-L-alanine amidase